MLIFADFLMIVAIGLLLLSVKPALIICMKTEEPGWKLLLGLIVAFSIAYVAYLAYLLGKRDANYVDIGMTSILFGGSIFVSIVLRFSLSTILKIERIAKSERHNALHDSLTGLPNRAYCSKAMTERLTAQTPFSVLLFDINNFKNVNDAMGHQTGDLLLVNIAKRISVVVPPDAFYSRIGGDEFVIILNTNSKQRIDSYCTEIAEQLSPRFQLEQYNLPVSASIGVSIFPDFGSSQDELLKQADSAMYDAKRKGLSVSFYSDALEVKAKQQLDIASRITTALHNQEFRLYYQPIVNTLKQTLYGYEALIRWPQEDGSFISPELFIPIAEQTHLIRDITDWVINQVMLDLHIFNNAGIEASIHLNLSAHDLTSSALLDNLKQLAQSEQLDSSQVVLEVTESDMLKNIGNTKIVLEELRLMGFKISLDDFGTGYSSLTLLRELPIDQIKIDRSFVSSMHISSADHAIVTSSISLAHGLNCTVIAEGVEEQELIGLLNTAKCDYVQGFINGKALSLDEIIYWTEQHHLIMASNSA
ncbi:putative EAL and GGDEF domains protein [Vibrio tapetis subsp. tapetis]|uniref:Putative EAL and GGDEF domains protein n=2 Tax=Vibrio tapetis TaxID=52443 RepID=A0A2N8ZN95_9VIBR|nr:putative EAL and GGDEF domains protein [Vibrio tapetis subsp. tapetis]